MLGGNWEQGQVPRALDGNGQTALVFGTSASFPSIFDLAALGQIAAQGGHVLVVYGLGFLQAESAYFAAALWASPVCGSTTTLPEAVVCSASAPAGRLPSSFLGTCSFTHRFSGSPVGVGCCLVCHICQTGQNGNPPPFS